MKNTIDGEIFKKLLNFGYDNLSKNVQIVNELNVFPIPDGDTGDNMCMTLYGGVEAIKNVNTNSLKEVASKVADGMLMSARGNSGVILSQLFYGFCQSLKDVDEINIENFSKNFKFGVEKAYLAVDKPTEGTMLTVAKDLATFFEKYDYDKNDLDEFITSAIETVNNSVLDTPNKLEVLKKAGVVDSGGAGIYYIVEGINKYIRGQQIEEVYTQSNIVKDVDSSNFNENSKQEFGYCSEVLVQLMAYKCDIEKFDCEKLKDFLNSIGDSLVIVKTGSIVKIHVHTFEPYKLLQYCQQFGEFIKVKIENMTVQHNDIVVRNRFEIKQEEKQQERKQYGVVAVASGDGVKQLFTDFGVDVIVSGGQTDNPSTQDFINAFEKVNAENVFVLPNNSNIILTAKQASNLYKASNVRVIESKNIGDCYAILSMLDFSSKSVEEIETQMKENMQGTKTGMITKAIRTAECDNVVINNEDYIGFENKKMLTANSNKLKATFELIDKLDENNEICMLIYGKNATEEEVAQIKNYVNSNHGNLEFFEYNGAHDVYDFYVIIQ